MKLARSTVSDCFNYSTGFSNDVFLGLRIRPRRRNYYGMQVIVQIYKLSHPALGTKLRFAKFKQVRLHIALAVNQGKLSHWKDGSMA